MCIYKITSIPTGGLTPPDIYINLPGRKKFLLESTQRHEKKGTYSFIGMNPYQEVIGSGNYTTVIDYKTNTKEMIRQLPLEYIKNHFPHYDLNLPFPFFGGGVGFIGYDAIRQYASLGEELQDDLEMPDLHFMLYENTIIFDHQNEKIHIVTINVNGRTEEEVEQNLSLLQKFIQGPASPPFVDTYFHFRAETTKESFIEKVRQIKEYILQGEVHQVVLSQRFKADIKGCPFSYYQQLRKSNPSPYMFYIDFEDYILLGSSPESLIQTSGKKVSTNPIAGTKPRGKTKKEDEFLLKELVNDQKEISEHRMLVNLSKEDLSKVCKTESITVPTYMKVEKYQHVMHLVSEVQGILKTGFSSIDALLSCLPAGTVSGSPKIRAMQIINELEEMKRGVYAGGIGYINFQHDINFAIAIRSLVIKNNQALLQAGAGIVLASAPEKEYEETINKARSLMDIAFDHSEITRDR